MALLYLFNGYIYMIMHVFAISMLLTNYAASESRKYVHTDTGIPTKWREKNKKDKNDIRGDALFPVFWIIVDR